MTIRGGGWGYTVQVQGDRRTYILDLARSLWVGGGKVN
jgi:hypothetical protein